MHPLLSRLRRITSGATWIPEIDGLRFVAIFSVVAFHIGGQVVAKSIHPLAQQAWYQPLLKILSNGNRGVELFFVISGFILGRPFARHALLGEKPVSLTSYYLRRLTRLEPPYVINLLLFSLALVIYSRLPILELAQHFLASALYIHELVYHEVSIINGVTWSLEIEIQFYIIVPLLVLLFKIRNGLARRTAIAAAVIGFSAFQQWSFQQGFWGKPEAIIYESVLFFLQYFLAGFLVCDLYLTLLPRWKPSFLWDLVSLVCWCVYFSLDVPGAAVILPPVLILAFLGAFRGIVFPRLFRLQFIALTGGMCYTIYLWHFFLIAFFFKATRYLHIGSDYLVNLVLQCILLLPPVLLVCIILFLAIERPCMDPQWPRKLAAKWKAATEKSAAA